VLLCKPELLTRPGLVDPRHLRTAAWKHRVRELPADIIETMAGMSPYKVACKGYGYDWDADTSDPPRFDYTTIDPFRGRDVFDNGEPIGPSLPKVYLHEVVDASIRWPDPTLTDGDSFWTWLRSPANSAMLNADVLPGTLTNLMAARYGMRPDLQTAFPDPVGRPRPYPLPRLVRGPGRHGVRAAVGTDLARSGFLLRASPSCGSREPVRGGGPHYPDRREGCAGRVLMPARESPPTRRTTSRSPS
jgi:hypothetical protein